MLEGVGGVSTLNPERLGLRGVGASCSWSRNPRRRRRGGWNLLRADRLHLPLLLLQPPLIEQDTPPLVSLSERHTDPRQQVRKTHRCTSARQKDTPLHASKPEKKHPSTSASQKGTPLHVSKPERHANPRQQSKKTHRSTSACQKDTSIQFRLPERHTYPRQKDTPIHISKPERCTDPR